MKNNPSRRLFLQKSALATTGVALLSSTSLVHAFTKKGSPFAGYNPYAEEKTDLRNSSLFGKHITIKGRIFDETGTFSIPNAKVEIWHLSPNSNKYRHRTKLTTNAAGEYQFITDFPNREKGKNARIYFKISDNEKVYYTELILTDHGAFITGKHWEENRRLGEKLFPKKETFLNQSSITHNITI